MSSGHALSPLQSETYFETDATEWLFSDSEVRPGVRQRLLRLAEVVQQNHGDRWLRDFLVAPSSTRANRLLQSAIEANYKSDSRAEQQAVEARRLFVQDRNSAGAARSEFELVYALHRGSHADRCVKEVPRLQAMLQGRSYHWLETQLLLELSACKGMLTEFDAGWQLTADAIAKAQAYHFPVLGLRAIGFQASFHTVEGRFLQSWRFNSLALAAFWADSFPADRAFQFYSDLELAAERSEEWNLACVLQREVLVMLAESGRTKLEALAHFRLVGLLESVGNLAEAEREVNRASELFDNRQENEQTDLYRTYSEVMLATILLRHGDVEAASQHIEIAGEIAGDRWHQWNNFNLKFRYFKAAAEIARYHDDPQEEALLTELVASGDSGFAGLRSAKDRWDWDREIGPGYRRLLEREAMQPNSEEQALADWEYYRTKAASTTRPVSGPPLRNRAAKRLLLARTGRLANSTLLTFAILPAATLAWVADNRGVRQFTLNVNSADLAKEVRQFHLLCSNQQSPMQKVIASGSRLYNWLIAPLESELDPKRALFIEADEMLGLVPWTALVMKNGTYFGESYEVTNTPGLFLAPRSRLKQSSAHALVMEPGAVEFQGATYLPLPQAAKEAQEVALSYAGSTLLTGKQATAEALLRQLPKASVFQFAGHATEREYGGELLLHDESGAGATLSASGLSNVKLTQTRLVVLSACSTAFSSREVLTSPHGLVSAFLMSGAESVIASNWDVDSASTAEMMVNFHRLFRTGHSASHTFRLTRHAILSRNETAHPYFWAAFSEFGRVP